MTPEDILVTVQGPYGDTETTLAEWMQIGPGNRPLLSPIKPRERRTGRALPIDVIPMAYRNTKESRRLIREGHLPRPEGEGWDEACSFLEK
jgi:hypothetical protein